VSNWRSEATLTFRYALVGVLNSAVGFGVILLLTYAKLDPILANVLGYAAGLTIGFALSKTFVFRTQARARGEIARYVAAFALCYLLNLAILVFATRVLRLGAIVAQLAAIASYVIAMFLCSRFFVFGR